MTGITDFPALVIATLIFLAIPGPGTIKLLATVGEPNGGWRAGLYATLGLIAGDTVWMVLALSGVAALAAAYPQVFAALRYLGALYLAYVGYSLIRDATKGNEVAEKVNLRLNRGPKDWSKESMLVSLSNPKVIGFYVAFFPLFIDLNTFDGIATYARMMGIVVVIAFLYCLFLISVFRALQAAFIAQPWLGVWLKRLAGAALIGFSVKFALTG